MTGNPAKTPFSVDERSPFSTPGTYSFGTAPPTTSFSNTNPLPGGNGSKRVLVRAYWPAPPVCFLCRESFSARRDDPSPQRCSPAPPPAPDPAHPLLPAHSV